MEGASSDEPRVVLDAPEGFDGHSDGTFSEPAGETAATEAARPWRVAQSLLTLRDAVNAAFPGRSKAGDGTIGDAAHASRASDHNPWVVDGAKGVVTAIDITHDPARGCSSAAIVEAIRATRDPRVKYMIWNRRIASSEPKGALPAWAWRAYTGANPHTHHCHISVKANKTFYDSGAPWQFRPIAEAAPVPDDPEQDVVNAFIALQAGLGERPLEQVLVDAQDELPRLIARLAEIRRAEGGPQADVEARPTLASLREGYLRLWQGCVIRPEKKGEVAWYLKKLLANRQRYEQVAAATGAPWWFIAITHALEAGFNFGGHLHNGDPLTARTVQVPKGRPAKWNPPSDWVASAIDAITYQGYANLADWSLAAALYRFEGYNGFGYRPKGLNSPYLWSFTNQYSKGKYVADGRFDANAVSKQCGAAAMLKALQASGAATVTG